MDHLVTSCQDDGTAGTLRSVIQDPMTQSGDSINLTMLPMMCSRITLGGTAISVTQNELHIHGPGADQLVIDGNHNSAVFDHSGSGTLGVTGVTIANGYYLSTSVMPWGGCVHSDGSVLMLNAVVTGCVLKNLSSIETRGAGIYTHGYLTLFNSAVTDNKILTNGANARGFGGGVFVRGDFTALYSTISGNVAIGSNGAKTGGGGAFAAGNVDIEGTTVSGNRSQDFFGGIEVYSAPPATVKVSNSTISSNLSRGTGGGIFSNIPMTLANSTVVFNTYASPGIRRI
jgi:hypothetical protein